MLTATQCISTLLYLFLFTTGAYATDVYYSDKTVVSDNGAYRLEAKSPDNADKEHSRPFQRNFVYTLYNTKTGRKIWARKVVGGNSSCKDIFVSDNGWSVIRTGWDYIIPVDPEGTETGKIDILQDAIPKEEFKKYVHETTAGYWWSGYSRWYFISSNEAPYFIIRCWWGRHIIINLKRGALAASNGKITGIIINTERDFVLSTLETAVKNKGRFFENKDGLENIRKCLTAAHMAGRLKIKESIPYLRSLEEVTYSGTSSYKFFADNLRDGGVHPFYYSVFTMRQVAHLSLRRLGERPSHFPCTLVRIHYADLQKERYIPRERYIVPKPLSGPREKQIDRLKKGMMPEEIMDLIGLPDFIDSSGEDLWEYDMDASAPFTLVIKLGAAGIVSIEIKKPPLWKDGNIRDSGIIH